MMNSEALHDPFKDQNLESGLLLYHVTLTDYFHSIDNQKNHFTRQRADNWLRAQLAKSETSLDTISELIQETTQYSIKIMDSPDLSEKQAIGARLLLLKEAQAIKKVPASSKPFELNSDLSSDLAEYHKIQKNYLELPLVEYENAEKAYHTEYNKHYNIMLVDVDWRDPKVKRTLFAQSDRLTAATRKLESLDLEAEKRKRQEAYNNKLKADDWLRARFKKVEYGDIVKVGQDEFGIAKDEARKAELLKAISDDEANLTEANTVDNEARKIRLKKLKKAQNQQLKAGELRIEKIMLEKTKEWFFYFLQYLAFKMYLRKMVPTKPQPSPLTRRDWLSGFGSILLNLDYALLCAISVFSGVQALDWPFYSSIVMAIIGASMTAMVNLWGFRNNILSLLRKNRKQIPVTKLDGSEDTYRARLLYKWILFPMTGFAALVTTALAASTISGALGVTGYWSSAALVMTFGITFVAMWGLFTQEPRKWFEGTNPENPKRNDAAFLERTKKSISELLGITADKDLVDESKEAATTLHRGRAAFRLALSIVITALTTYASFMLAPRASDLLLGGIHSFVDHIFSSGTALGGDKWLSPLLQVAFISTWALYNAATGIKLSTFFTRLFCGLPVATDDGKKHGFFYKFIYPIMALWNATNNGAFNGAELNNSNESHDAPEDPNTPPSDDAKLTSTEKVQIPLTIVSASCRSGMFFSATRMGQPAKDIPLQDLRIRGRLNAV